jgi:transcriptional regulator with XRE-family HTH domain
MNPGELIRRCRQAAGLSQAELAVRMGTTQSAVARLESNRSNPRFGTVVSALRAAGHELELRARTAEPTVDEEQIRERLKLTPAQRLATFAASMDRTRRLLERAGPPRARST